MKFSINLDDSEINEVVPSNDRIDEKFKKHRGSKIGQPYVNSNMNQSRKRQRVLTDSSISVDSDRYSHDDNVTSIRQNNPATQIDRPRTSISDQQAQGKEQQSDIHVDRSDPSLLSKVIKLALKK